MLSRRPTEKQKWTEERRYFESDGRPLYAAMYRAERPGAPMVLFCNSFSENHCEGRAEAIAARIIAANGYSAFLYHPRAHGDSAGEDPQEDEDCKQVVSFEPQPAFPLGR